uniref:Uncharacterized protein n=1 Tax=Triticum urartu TaxID=4572 RepID=A0A8R7U0D8_TRIUA
MWLGCLDRLELCSVHVHLHGRRLLGSGLRRERLLPAGGARLARGEPSVNAPDMEAVVAARQHAYALALLQVGEADGALGGAAHGELDPRRVLHRRDRPDGGALARPLLLAAGAGSGVQRGPLQAIGLGVAGGLRRAVAHAPRDAARALDERADHERHDEDAEEQRQDRDHRRVHGAEGARGRRLPRRAGRRHRHRRRRRGVRQKPPGMHASHVHRSNLYCLLYSCLCVCVCVFFSTS